MSGARTPPVSAMRTMDDLCAAFSAQLEHQISSLIRDLRWAERANADHHPTPLASLLIDGCIRTARDVTWGGAAINFSGIQCVGPVDVGDSLAAVERLVFRERVLTMPQLVEALRENLPNGAQRSRMERCPKFGNDDPDADKWTAWVIGEFVRILESHGTSTRGGPYVAGIYSATSHEQFGRVTGALPSGRRRGESLGSGIAPANGADRMGPTALLNSMNRLDFAPFSNGINFNMKFPKTVLRGSEGPKVLEQLLGTYFARGGMQAQVNVLDAETLGRAKIRPELHADLMVRVSGYSAYFTDLTSGAQDEIIARTENLP